MVEGTFREELEEFADRSDISFDAYGLTEAFLNVCARVCARIRSRKLQGEVTGSPAACSGAERKLRER